MVRVKGKLAREPSSARIPATREMFDRTTNHKSQLLMFLGRTNKKGQPFGLSFQKNFRICLRVSFYGAGEGTRTPKKLPSYGPEPYASASSATPALTIDFND